MVCTIKIDVFEFWYWTILMLFWSEFLLHATHETGSFHNFLLLFSLSQCIQHDKTVQSNYDDSLSANRQPNGRTNIPPNSKHSLDLQNRKSWHGIVLNCCIEKEFVSSSAGYLRWHDTAIWLQNDYEGHPISSNPMACSLLKLQFLCKSSQNMKHIFFFQTCDNSRIP